MKSIDIKGKEYFTVNERIKEFHKRYDSGSIITEIISNVDGVVIFKATVRPNAEFQDKAFIGHAYEKEGSTFINKTSYVENCETSAVGRALGMLGIGIDTSVASADEVQNAMANQIVDKLELSKKVSTAYDLIDNATTLDELTSVGAEITDLKLNKFERKTVEGQWKAKKAELGGEG